MEPKSAFLALAASTFLLATAAAAADIDMNDPRRAVGREDDVRIDAQLTRDNVSPGIPISVTYQIQNFTSTSVAVADKLSDASYDEDERTITLAIGAEVPVDGNMPHMVLIAPGEKKVLRASAVPVLTASALRAVRNHAPRYVQVKVTILREITPFAQLIQTQSKAQLSDELFNQWMEGSESIFLNSVPISWSGREANPGSVDASQRAGRGRGGF
ncbi:MAG TPA: hypothetical protein VKB93_08340 [Thermoanaerobaculia bacterium]|nr:hypothetical protein [Thermoanaerobaculia bacterium]